MFLYDFKKQTLSLESKSICSIKSYLSNNIIEYIDLMEESISIATLNEKNVNIFTSHLEIDNFSMVGFVTEFSPFSNHNQAPRNSYHVN